MWNPVTGNTGFRDWQMEGPLAFCITKENSEGPDEGHTRLVSRVKGETKFRATTFCWVWRRQKWLLLTHTLGHTRERHSIPGRKSTNPGNFLAQSEHNLLLTASSHHAMNTKKLTHYPCKGPLTSVFRGLTTVGANLSSFYSS